MAELAILAIKKCLFQSTEIHFEIHESIIENVTFNPLVSK